MVIHQFSPGEIASREGVPDRFREIATHTKRMCSQKFVVLFAKRKVPAKPLLPHGVFEYQVSSINNPPKKKTRRERRVKLESENSLSVLKV